MLKRPSLPIVIIFLLLSISQIFTGFPIITTAFVEGNTLVLLSQSLIWILWCAVFIEMSIHLVSYLRKKDDSFAKKETPLWFLIAFAVILIVFGILTIQLLMIDFTTGDYFTGITRLIIVILVGLYSVTLIKQIRSRLKK